MGRGRGGKNWGGCEGMLWGERLRQLSRLIGAVGKQAGVGACRPNASNQIAHHLLGSSPPHSARLSAFPEELR